VRAKFSTTNFATLRRPTALTPDPRRAIKI
jgi:hypothetical protein